MEQLPIQENDIEYNKKYYLSGIRLIDMIQKEVRDLQPDTHKMSIMMFTSSDEQTRQCFEEYRKHYGLNNLLDLDIWQPLLLRSVVDSQFEDFTRAIPTVYKPAVMK